MNDHGSEETHPVEPDSVPAAELEVLACLWQRGRATARSIREAMAPYRPMSHGAMLTLLKRLEEKGLVRRTAEKVGKAHIYRAAGEPERTFGQLLRETRRRIFGGSGVSMVASLFESAPPNEQELDELTQLLDDLRRQHDEKGEFDAGDN